MFIWDFVANPIMAVSYTHLDVYKRQSYSRLRLAKAQAIPALAVLADPVHLAVIPM